MEKIEVAGGAAENDADVDAEAVTEETEALREAFRKGWDKALTYRREHGTEEEAARAAAEASTDDREPSPLVDDPITREIHERAERAAAREALLATIMSGPDLASWVAPRESVVSDELLAEHLAQLRNTVRYALSCAFDGDYGLGERLSAANTATRMIRANIALAKELKASKSKTVRGGKRVRGTQD